MSKGYVKRLDQIAQEIKKLDDKSSQALQDYRKLLIKTFFEILPEAELEAGQNLKYEGINV